MRKLGILLLVLVIAPCANGQLLVGNDDTASTNAWEVNVNDGTAVILWEGTEAWGMAYDGLTNTVYANDGSLLRWGDLGSGAPANELTVVDVTGGSLSMVGLAWANGELYASRNIANEAIYSIDLGSGLASVLLDYDDGSYDFGGLAYNPLDGLFYGTNDDTTPFGRGLYSIDAFGDGTISLIAPYPAGRTDIDGLAVGNNIAYLVEDESGDTIHPYDLVNGIYLPDLPNPMTSSEVFSGAAFVPEPATLLLLGWGGLMLRRRCKK